MVMHRVLLIGWTLDWYGMDWIEVILASGGGLD